jgi:hypothetical protein
MVGEIAFHPWGSFIMKTTYRGKTRYEKSFFTLERVFITSSLVAYALPLVSYWALDISLNQEIVLFFGTQMLLFFSLMLYGSIKGLLPGKSARSHKARHQN